MNEYQEIYDGTAASAPERTLPKERPVTRERSVSQRQ